MLSDVSGTYTGNSSICHQWCTTLLVLLSFIFLVKKAKINMSKVYYLCLGRCEAHRLVYFLFLTSGAPLDCSYSPVFLPTPCTEGQNNYTRSVLYMPSDIWVTRNVNLSIFHQWCATWSVLFYHFPCLLMVQRGKTYISDVYYLCPLMYAAHRPVTYPFVTSGAPLDWCYSPVYSVYFWPDCLNKYKKG